MDKHSTDKELNKTQTFIRGSDPRTATCRGKLQSQRCKLNQEINKELRLRAGAENLYKATTNRKLKDTVAIELSFVNSNLQLLKEKLSELNSSVEIYQNDSRDPIIPMIPLGLKETKEVNLIQPLSDFIQEHYSEDATLYVDPIADLMDTRQAARTPTRDLQGVALLFRYFNLLYFVERRFFSPDRNLGIYFEWYDSLTGVPSSQRTIAFEKAGILFNLGAIYTQIGARQDRNSEKGLDSAVNNFLRAAGIFKHIAETFTNAPSIDLKPQVLEILVSIMLIQARECLYEKLNLQIDHLTLNDLNHLHHDLSGEAAQLMREYNDMHSDIQSNGVLNFIPECWVSLIPLKAEYYKALSHYHAAKSINEKLKSNVNEKNGKSKRETFIYEEDEYTLNSNVNPIAVKKAHIKESIASLEETQRLQRMSRDLKGKVSLTAILQNTYLRAQEEKDILDEEHENIVVDDYDLIDIKVEVSSKFTLSLTSPDFTTFKVDDPFKRLGPIAIFSARRHWTSPRSIRLHKGNNIGNNNNRRSTTNGYCKCKTSTGFTHTGQCEICMKYDTYGSHEGSNDSKSDETIEGFGFNIRGDAPVIISHVEYNSLAFLGGMKEGDFIVEVMGIDVKWYTNDQVLKLIHNASSTVELKLITPINRNYLKPIPMSSKSTVSTLSGNSSSGISSGRTSPIYNTSPSKVKAKKSGNLTSGVWNPFRRTQSMGKIF